MSEFPNLNPEIITGTAISTGVFFGFQKRTSTLIIKNRDATNDLLFHFELASGDSPFSTIKQGEDEETILDSAMGVHIKSNAGQTALFELIGKVDYLK